MSTYDLMIKRRTIRKFKQEQIPFEILEKCVNAARLAPSAANLQPLEFVIVDDPDVMKKIFPFFKWAGYIVPKGNPKENERPVAYIAILADKEKSPRWYHYDVGLAAENIVLTALENGIGACIVGALDRDKVREILKVPSHLYVDQVIALGYPAEEPVVEDLKDSVEYWKDENGVLHVPKKKLNKILHRNCY